MSLISLAKYSVPQATRRIQRPVYETKSLGTPFVRVGEGVGEGKEVETKKQEYVEKVVQHIPSEAVGFYIFAAGLFQNVSAADRLSASDGRTIVFYLTLVLTPTLAWYLTGKKLEDDKVPHPYRPRREHWWKMFAATLAFVVWAAAMPGSVFAAFSWYDSRLAVILLALVALVLPKLSDAILKHDK
jgi:hypothetical protein